MEFYNTIFYSTTVLYSNGTTTVAFCSTKLNKSFQFFDFCFPHHFFKYPKQPLKCHEQMYIHSPPKIRTLTNPY